VLPLLSAFPEARPEDQLRARTKLLMALARREPLEGASLYDALYKGGYHDNINFSHAREILPFVLDTIRETDSSSVLDVGCSHGFAVQQLWAHGVHASGMDLSKVAVDLAIRTRGNQGLCVPPCFTQGSATALPWANNSFDIVMSSDVLEHLQPADVPVAVSEFSRVARRALILKIAMRGAGLDGHQRERIAQRAGGDVVLPDNLHPTVRHPSFWWSAFKTADPSWEVRPNPRWATARTDNRTQLYAPGRPYSCCTFGLVRMLPAASTAPRASRSPSAGAPRGDGVGETWEVWLEERLRLFGKRGPE
jgi:SAM-dependent methyltransferase